MQDVCLCRKRLVRELEKAGCAGAEAVMAACVTGAEAAQTDLQPDQCLPFDYMQHITVYKSKQLHHTHCHASPLLIHIDATCSRFVTNRQTNSQADRQTDRQAS